MTYSSGKSESKYPNLSANKLTSFPLFLFLKDGLNQTFASFTLPISWSSAKDENIFKFRLIKDMRFLSFIFDSAQ